MIGECTRSSCVVVELRDQRERALARRVQRAQHLLGVGGEGVVLTARAAMSRLMLRHSRSVPCCGHC